MKENFEILFNRPFLVVEYCIVQQDRMLQYLFILDERHVKRNTFLVCFSRANVNPGFSIISPPIVSMDHGNFVLSLGTRFWVDLVDEELFETTLKLGFFSNYKVYQIFCHRIVI